MTGNYILRQIPILPEVLLSPCRDFIERLTNIFHDKGYVTSVPWLHYQKKAWEINGNMNLRSDSRDNPSMRTTEEHIQALFSRRSTKIGNCTPIGVLDL